MLVPFLFIGGSLLFALLAALLLQRLVRELVCTRRAALVTRYRPLIDGITQAGATPESLERLRRTPRAHRRLIGSLLLAPLHATRGDVVAHVREAATALGLVEQWVMDVQHRAWWRRAEGVRSLGFVQAGAALPAIAAALADAHGEVRAAAVEAAGRLGDPAVVPALLAHVADGCHYQRARVIDALRSLGPQVTPALVALAQARPEHALLAAEVLGLIGTTAAIAPLLRWCGDTRSEVRAAALGALGSIGVDDRSCGVALQALGDADPLARAMAARALGRGRRVDAVGPLAERLDDAWLPAAQAAQALRRLGGAGHAALRARAADEGQAGDLARQMLWSQQPASGEA